jgi:hypothetical protein
LCMPIIIVLSNCEPVYYFLNRICGVMVIVLPSSAVDRRFEPRSDKSKDYRIGICCFSTKHTTLRSKSKDWLTQNQNNVSEWKMFLFTGVKFRDYLQNCWVFSPAVFNFHDPEF